MDRFSALQKAPGLQQFVLQDVKRPSKPKRIGVGSYGSVDELEIGGIICAGKTIHDTLIDVENVGAENIVQRYIQECQLMGSLHHPHIVQFMGICFLPESRLPVLVMEYLTANLDNLLETQPNIPLSLKRSILHDVARGLIYLHGHNPRIIHRDLTARNVLLNPAMTAKIADFGNSRIVDLSLEQVSKTMSRVPGTQAYLPPEGFDEHPRYTPKLDMFSFGQLSLYTVIQVFPVPLAPTFTDPISKVVVARSEIERRRQYMKKLETQLAGYDSFREFVMECLANHPDCRPSANQVSNTLEELRTQILDPYGHLTKLDMIRRLSESPEGQQQKECSKREEYAAAKRVSKSIDWELQIKQLEEQKSNIEHLCEAKEKLLQAREAENCQQAEIIRQKRREFEAKHKRYEAMQAEKQQQANLIHQLESQVANLEGLCQIKDKILEAMEAENQQQTKVMENKHSELKRLEAQLKSNEVEYEEEMKKKQDELTTLQSKLHVHQLEIGGLERLCKAKDKLIQVKVAEKQQIEEEIRQKIEEIGLNPAQFITTVSDGDNDTDISSVGKCAPEAILEENGQTNDDDQPKVKNTLLETNHKAEGTAKQDSGIPIVLKEKKHNIKIVVCGSGGVGKSALVIRYVQNQFVDEYDPTIFDDYFIKRACVKNGYRFILDIDLWDSAGQEEYAGCRNHAFSESDFFLTCFSVDSKRSFEDIRSRWIQEIRRVSSDTPMLLVGLKTDLEHKREVTAKEGKQLAEEFGTCHKYLECSAKTGEGVQEVFNKAIHGVVDQLCEKYEQRHSKFKMCVIQ